MVDQTHIDWRWQEFVESSDHLRPDPEALASAVLERTDRRAVGRVDPVGVLGYWAGLSLTYEDIAASGYILDLDWNMGEVIVRRADPVVRQRFTIAHELGHWLLGPPRSIVSATLGEHDQTRHKDPILESWCDRFAAALLLPVSAEAVQRTMRGSPTQRWQQIRDLPTRMNVSRDVAWRRMAELGIADVVQLGPTGGNVAAHYAQSVTNGEKIELQRFAKRSANGETTSRFSDTLLVAKADASGVFAVRLRR